MALLNVRCLWHEKVHGESSPITSLISSATGNDLYCGSMMTTSSSSSSSPDAQSVALRINPQNGTLNQSLVLPAHGALHTMCFDDTSSSLHCCCLDGTVVIVNTVDGTAAVVATYHSLSTTTSSSRPSSADRSSSSSSSSSSTNILQSEKVAAAAPRSEGAPEFLRSQGYRGPKEGYVYREGSQLGIGYYRKDVVRKYAVNTSEIASECTTVAAAAAAPSRTAPPKGTRCCTVSPSFDWMATATNDPNDGSISVWHLPLSKSSNQVAITLSAQSAGVLCLTASCDGRLLFSGSYDQTVRVWDTATWSCLKVLRGHGGGVRALAVAADGRSLYSAAADNTVRAWSIGAGICLRLMHGRHEDTTWPGCMALSPSIGEIIDDGEEKKGNPQKKAVLVTGSTGPFGASTLKAFDPSTGSCLATFAHLGYDQRGGLTALAFSPGGEILYSGASDGSVAAWALEWNESKTQDTGQPTLRRGFFS